MARAVVTCREAQEGGKELLAYVVMRAGTAFDQRCLRDHVRALLPGYMVPSHYVEITTTCPE